MSNMQIPLPHSGYYRKKSGSADLFLIQTSAGTPGGEYQRRFWHPVAYEDEIADVPFKVRALGEDLVLFKDGAGKVGCLTIGCCHRNTSLEYGIVEARGLRCCYHGRLFATDGRMLEIPGEPNAERMMATMSQGAYPAHVYCGLVFIYMGPPERIPVFPDLDRTHLPGIRLVNGFRFLWECNWMQIKENSMDPWHTHVLHMIPQMRGVEKQFDDSFGEIPFFTWVETPAGCMYLGARRVGDNIWVRSSETFGANLHIISSIFESGKKVQQASAPFMTMWTLPVDDTHSINFYISHILDNDPMPFSKRRELEAFGQNGDRPYRDRQWIPGDYDAMVSQGAEGLNPHELEHLGSQDRGVTMFRRFIRRGIEAVQEGRDPVGFFMDQSEVPPTFASDHVAPITEVEGDPGDREVLRRYCENLAAGYREHPPMRRYLELARVRA